MTRLPYRRPLLALVRERRQRDSLPASAFLRSATGDIFRQNIKDETPLGVQVKAIVDAGDYVPDSLTNELVTSRLLEEDCENGFLLDGYPRTLEQISYLRTLLESKGQKLDAVILLNADTDEVIARLRKRALEQGRTDDTEDAIRHRQDVFARETTPLVPVYRDMDPTHRGRRPRRHRRCQ